MTRPQRRIELLPGAVDRLLPMHLLLDRQGRILSVGATLQKILTAGAGDVAAMFLNARPDGARDPVAAIRAAAATGERLFLRLRRPPSLDLRGHAVSAGDLLLVNLGFGIALPEAVRDAQLTERDFAPSDLAMELLFMREAIRGVLGELSRFNLQLETAREAAELQAQTDPLTGLLNRRGLEAGLSDLRRVPRTGFALAHLDLDHFKTVNDRWGHAMGDQVLRRVADVLRQETRAGDIAARIGGDEFVVILRGLDDVRVLKRRARRIIAGIEDAISARGDGCKVSASIGIVLSHRYGALPVERMLTDADAALYRSKHDGRGRVTILTDMLPGDGSDPAPAKRSEPGKLP